MKSLTLRLIMLLVFSASVVTFAQQSIEGRVVAATLNVRSAPQRAEDNVIAQLTAQTLVSIEGRTEANDWLYIRTQDGSVTGWGAAAYIAYDPNLLPSVPVTDGSAPVQAGDSAPEAPQIVMPEDHSREFIMSIPVLYNFTSDAVYSIFRRGQLAGNSAHVFMKVGDSVTATQPFMYAFGSGEYNLGPYGDLQPTIDWFNVSPRAGISSSFARDSLSAVNGFVSGAVLDGTWSPEYCGRLVPLACEYDIMRPSVAIVLLGGQDLRLFDAASFQLNMRRIADTLRSLGVIPVFTTFPMHPSYRLDETYLFNSIVITVAQEFNIPVINLYRAIQDLPESGAKPDDVVHLTQGETYFSFTGEEALYGVTLRNLLTLQALDVLRREVLS